MKTFKHVMLDLETMSTGDDAVLTGIGAVEFNIETGERGREFYEKVDIQSCLDLGMTVDGSTIYWWLEQSEAARMELIRDRKSIQQVLFKMSHWFAACHPNFQIWGNGKSFDLPKLRTAFTKVSQSTPWHYYNERDVRTMVMLRPGVKDSIPFKGIKHHAISDCRYQIDLVCEIWEVMQSNATV